MHRMLSYVIFIVLASCAKEKVDRSVDAGIQCNPHTFGIPFCCGPGTDTLTSASMESPQPPRATDTIAEPADSTCVDAGGPGTDGGLLCTTVLINSVLTLAHGADGYEKVGA